MGKAPAAGCPRARSHRPGILEGHAHEAIGQWQVRRPGLLGVDRSARTQRRAQGTRKLGSLLGDPWLQADSEEEPARAPGAARRPLGSRAGSRPERMDLQFEDASRPCLGQKGNRVMGPQVPRRPMCPAPPPQDLRVAPPPIIPFQLRPDLGKEKERQDHRSGQELEHPLGDHGLSEVWGAAATASGALYLRERLRPFRQPPGSRGL